VEMTRKTDRNNSNKDMEEIMDMESSSNPQPEQSTIIPSHMLIYVYFSRPLMKLLNYTEFILVQVLNPVVKVPLR